MNITPEQAAGVMQEFVGLEYAIEDMFARKDCDLLLVLRHVHIARDCVATILRAAARPTEER